MKGFGVFCLIAGIFAATDATQAEEQCGPQTAIELSGSVNAPWTMQIELKPQDVPLNKPFDAFVIICDQGTHSPNRITVDATMPAHKHGMNYEPKTTQIGRRRYEVKNLVFHMPGIWRLEVTAYEDGKPHRYTYDVPLR